MASDTRSNNQWSKVSTNLFIAASSGTSFVEAATLYPFEVIKTRQQVSLALLLYTCAAVVLCRWPTVDSGQLPVKCSSALVSAASTRQLATLQTLRPLTTAC